MAVSDFIKNRFISKELCICFGQDAETITYNDSWASNREYFRGVVEEVSEGVIVLKVPEHGILYINNSQIFCFWEPGFDYYKASAASIKRRK